MDYTESLKQLHDERAAKKAEWERKGRAGEWRAACDKPDYRSDAELLADFHKNGNH